MVCAAPATGGDVSNRGIGRARLFVGGLLLLAAVITWFTGFLLNPEGTSAATGTGHVRSPVASFLTKNAIGTLVLSAVSAWLLFPTRRPKWPARDWAIAAALALLVGSSLYQLVSLELL